MDRDSADGTVVLATRQELFRILAFLDGLLPKSAPIHSLVLSAILSHNSSFKVFYIKATDLVHSYLAILGIKNETFLDAKQQSHTIWVTTTWEHSEPEHLCKIYDSVKEIDWKKDALVSFGNGEVPAPIVLRHLAANKAKLSEDKGSPCYQYYLPIEEALDLQVGLSDEVYVKSLEREHASIVYENWTYKASTTVDHVADEIDQLPSAGAFLKTTDQLVSWMVCHPPNGMSRLHTVDGYRRKGYAKLLTRYLSKRFAQSGYVPFVNIVNDNEASIKFFQSLGFRLLGRQYVYVSVPSCVVRSTSNCT